MAILADADVLTALSEHLSPGELTQTIDQLLRVPSTWNYLRRPGILTSLKPADRTLLSPAPLAFHSIGAKPDSLPQSIPQDLENQRAAIWKRTTQSAYYPDRLEDVALLAIGLIELAKQPGGFDQISSMIVQAPACWHDPLVCSWAYLQYRKEILANLISNGSYECVALICDSLIANGSIEQVASDLFKAAPDMIGKLLILIQPINEPALSKALADLLTQSSDPQIKFAGYTSVERIAAQGISQLAKGDLKQARGALNQSWNAAVRTTAIVADQLAEAARLEGDYVVEVEARRQAFHSHPTPQRRARIAASLLNLGRPDEALACLPSDCECTEECIAAGQAYLDLGDTDQSSECFLNAAERLKGTRKWRTYWLGWLAQGLTNIGQISLALAITEKLVDSSPSDPQGRIRLARILLRAGDNNAAINQAQLALALAPDSIDACRILARSLQHAGKPGLALLQWQSLAQSYPSALPDLAECALAANDLALAKETSLQLLENNPDQTDPRIILAKVYAADGMTDESRTELEKVTYDDPQNPQAWIALTNVWESAGDSQAAGSTLARASQILPDSAELHHARAQWLKRQGRMSEALDEAEKSIQLDSNHWDWFIDYSDLLRQLGHDGRALNMLRRAHNAQPRNWKAMVALASMYQEQGTSSNLMGLFKDMPVSAPAEAHLAAGRIMLQAAEIGQSPAERAVYHLKIANNLGCTDPDLHFWLGKGFELRKQLHESIQSYQTYLSNSKPNNSKYREIAALGLANAALQTNEVVLAITTMEEGRIEHPESPAILIHLSKAYLSSGLLDQALETAKLASKMDPTLNTATRQLCYAAAESGEQQIADDALDRLINLSPENPENWLTIADCQLKFDRPLKVRQAIAKALRLKRTSADLLKKAASILMVIGQHASAQHILHYAAYIHPENAEVLIALAEVSEKADDLESAQKTWRRYAQVAPEDPEGLSRAADALCQLNRPAAAQEILQRAIAIAPNDAQIYAQLAETCLRVGENDTVKQLFSKAITLAPKDPAIYYRASKAALSSGLLAEAKEQLEQAIRLDPDCLEYQVTMGKCLLLQHKPLEARRILEKALPSAPSTAQAQALVSIAALETGDLKTADTAFRKAKAMPLATIEDRVWFSRAARHLGLWDQSSQALLLDANDTTLNLELIRTWIDLSEVDDIYRDLIQASCHAPDRSWIDSFSSEDLKSRLEPSSSIAANPEQIDRISMQLDLTFMESDTPALAKIEEAMQNSSDSRVLTSLALAHLRLNHPEKAMAALRQVHHNHQLNPRQNLLLGLALSKIGQYKLARRTYATAAENPILGPLADYQTGLSWLAENDLENATACISHAVASWPDEPAWQFQLGTIYLNQGETDAALPHLQQASDLDPENGQYLLELARTLVEAGQFSDAALIYERAIRIVPHQACVWAEAGDLALTLGDAVQASTRLERACSLDPSNMGCLLGSAKAALIMNRPNLALERVKAALRLNPKNSDALLALGEIYARQGKKEQAIEAYDQALIQAPDSLAILASRSRLLISAGKAKQAIAEIRNRLETLPDSDDLWIILAEASEAAGDLEAGMHAANEASQLAPRNITYKIALGRICQKLGQLDRALDELTQAQSLAPTDIRIPLAIGSLYEDRQEPAKALETYQRAISLQPENPDAHFRAGLILKQLKAYSKAAQMLKRVVALRPKDSNALHQLAAVQALELVHGEKFQMAVPQ